MLIITVGRGATVAPRRYSMRRTRQKKIPKGEYILKVKPLWMKYSYEYPILQRLKLGLTSPHPVTFKLVSW